MRVPKQATNVLYFHAFWNENSHTKIGDDFEILPKVSGKGRFLGCNLGIITDSSYGKSWWGEGEVKMYLDGDSNVPSLVGTGTEDYIGTAFLIKSTYPYLYQGCPIADSLNNCFFTCKNPLKEKCLINSLITAAASIYNLRLAYFMALYSYAGKTIPILY